MAYSVQLNLHGRRAVVVGGGPVGLRKLRGLITTGASVVLVAPHIHSNDELPPSVEWQQATYRPACLSGAFLVFAATDNAALNRQIVDDAKRLGVLSCSADAPTDGDFTLPAVLRRGDLSISVATDGKSPALAMLVRDRLAEKFGSEWAELTQLAGRLRQRLLKEDGHARHSRKLLQAWMDMGIEQQLKAGDLEGAWAELERLLADEIRPAETEPKGRL